MTGLRNRTARVAVVMALALLGATGCQAEGPGRADPTASGPAPGPTTFCDQPGQAVPGFRSFSCLVAAPSLVGNLLGDTPQIETVVLVPEALLRSRQRRPAVYLLAGFGSGTDYLVDGLRIELTDHPLDPTTAPVVVIAGGANGLGGSFYTNSPIGGRWEDAIADDLVRYVDTTYPTVPRAASRGVSGHSMGGTGALLLAMHRPDVFGAVYALSPGLFDEKGKELRFAGDQVERVLDALDQVRALPADQRGPQLAGTARDEEARFALAYGAAFAGDAGADTLLRYPFSRSPSGKVVRDERVWAEWDAGFGDLDGKVSAYGGVLRASRGVGIDVGTGDEYTWIPPGCRRMVKLLRAAGIPVVSKEFRGGHEEQLGERTSGHLLPFMIERLQREG